MEKTYLKDDHYDDAIQILKEYVNKYSGVKNLEIEFRLGYIENNKFKTDVKKVFFDKIHNILSNSNIWSSVINEKSIDYFHQNKRMTISENKEYCIKKEKLATIDFSLLGSGFDIRVSFSTETPISKININDSNYIREKNRFSYIFKHLSYDLTEVLTKDNGVDDYLFEVELEIKELDLKKMSSHYLIHDALLKITDLVKMCEEVDNNFKLELQTEKIY